METSEIVPSDHLWFIHCNPILSSAVHWYNMEIANATKWNLDMNRADSWLLHNGKCLENNPMEWKVLNCLIMTYSPIWRYNHAWLLKGENVVMC